jgi:hypothetical protein
VDVNVFVSAVVENSDGISSFKVFFDKINKSITTKSEMILERLMLLKDTAIKNDDQTSLDHLDWIEKAIKEENIYEPIIEIEQGEMDEEGKSTLAYVNMFTNNSNMKENKNDILKVHDSSQKKLKTVQFFKKQAAIEVTPFE